MQIPRIIKLASVSLAIGLLSAGSAFATRRGGVSGGGGGGIVELEPVGTAAVEQALREAPLALSLYFNGLEQRELNAPTETGRLLFRGERTVFDLLKSLAIETNGRCRDPHGRRRDGAAPGKRANSICMDVVSLGNQLKGETYWSQTIALAGHELSHLLGTNEALARELQSDMLKSLRFRPSLTAAGLRNSFFFEYDDFARALHKAVAGAPYGSARALHEAWIPVTAAADILKGQRWSDETNLRVTSADLYWLGRAIKLKSELLSYRAYLASGGNSASYEKILECVFGDKSAVGLADAIRTESTDVVAPRVAGIVIEQTLDSAAVEREIASIVRLEREFARALRTSVPATWVPILEKDSGAVGKKPVRWRTDQVDLSAKGFAIEANGKLFTADDPELVVSGDPGHQRYWSLELTWAEHGVEQRLFIYFESDGRDWWASEIRTNNGSNSEEWVYYYGDYFRRPLGEAFRGDLTLAGSREGKALAILRFKDLVLRVSPRQI